MTQKLHPATIAVTGGFLNDAATGATNPPLYLSNAYQFKSADSAANLFNLEEAGYIYTRMHNPTTTVLEERLAALEGGAGAVATATGHFAELMVFAALCAAGDEILASSRLYGGTINMLGTALKRFGITTRFADQRQPETWEALINENTKVIYLETLANPDSSIPDFEAISKIARKHRIPLVVDNTMATPWLFRPGEWGADVVVHSTTKYLCGNASVMGGVAIDIGSFDWEASGRFPQLTEPDGSYHGLSFSKAFGNQALAAYMRTKVLRDYGGTPSPFNSYITLSGIQTLHLRMPRHVENARAVADFLKSHPAVKSVSYSGMKEHKDYDLAVKYFPQGPGGLLTFEVESYEKAKKLIESIKLCIHAVNVGDARTVLTHPASTTHRQATAEQLAAAGISPSTIRLSAGIEDVRDIIADLEQAM
jgi:O-acetylhomoserine (thiol)-lyase